MINSESNYCTVCDGFREGTFCHVCGQKISAEQTTVYSLIVDFFSNVISLERSMFGMMWNLFKSPKKIVENYENGFRSYYSTPGRMLLYALTIAVVHLAFVDEKLLGLSFEVEDIQPQLSFWAIFLPMLIVSSYLSFFRVQSRFVRHIISMMYLSSACFILIVIIADLVNLLFDRNFGGWGFVVFLILVFILNARVNGKSRISFVLLNSLLQLLVISTLIAALFGLIYLFSPDVFRNG